MKKYITLGLVGLAVILTPFLVNQSLASSSAGTAGVAADATLNCNMYKTDGTLAVYGTVGLNTAHFLICNGQTTGDGSWHLFTSASTGGGICASAKFGSTTNWENSVTPAGVGRLMCQAP